jgi:Tol biopolymer transport system component
MWISGVLLLTAVVSVFLYSVRQVSRTGSATVLSRAIPLTTFRGNEASPSFSPDGNQVAFSWDGERRDNSDIYVKLVGQGRSVRVTNDPRPDICPSWSHDGRSIAFLRQLSDNEASLIVIPALGGRERTLLNLQTSYILGASKPAWSNDSKWLVISAATSSQSQQALARVSLESGQISWITQPDTSSGLHDVMPALSPNGSMLAFLPGWRRLCNSGFCPACF